MYNGEDRLRHDIIFKFIQKVIHLDHRSCRGILDREHRIVCCAFFDRLHCLPECPDMEIIDIFAKKLVHCGLTVCPFCPLEHDPGILLVQVIDPDKRQPPQSPRLDKLTVLKLPAHGHELLVQFLNAFLVKLSGYLRRNIRQFFFLSLPVKHFASGLYFIFSDFTADFHPLFIKFRDLVVYLIEFISEYFQ